MTCTDYQHNAFAVAAFQIELLVAFLAGAFHLVADPLVDVVAVVAIEVLEEVPLVHLVAEAFVLAVDPPSMGASVLVVVPLVHQKGEAFVHEVDPLVDVVDHQELLVSIRQLHQVVDMVLIDFLVEILLRVVAVEQTVVVVVVVAAFLELWALMELVRIDSAA